MIRIILLSFLGIMTLGDVFLIVYFYRKAQLEKMQKKQLLARGVKGFAEVVEKNRTAHTGSRSGNKMITIKYSGEDHLHNQSNDHQSNSKLNVDPNPYKSGYFYTYEVDGSEYFYTVEGQKIPIIYLPEKPEVVKILINDDTMRPTFKYLLPYVFLVKMLFFLFLFLQLLITDKTLLFDFIPISEF